MMNSQLQPLVEAIKNGKRKDAKSVTQEAIATDTDPQEILNALTEGMQDVGRRFKANEIFVPEVLVAARAMKTSMKLLEPLLAASGIEPEHTIIIGTVEGDLHDIGKNLVAMMLKGANFKVIDLGTNVTSEAFLKAVEESGAKVIALSALLTTTMPAMKETVATLKAADKGLKVMIGGAPITEAFASEIEADGYSEEAASAVDLAKKLVAA